MLTSSANQYLRPEYLTPLPTTLDAKKSPLALLAQTCSQIGADPPSNKSLLAPLEKSTSSKTTKSNETTREKSSPSTTGSSSSSSSSSTSSETVKSSFKPYESCLNREKASSPEEQRAPSSNSSSGRARTPGSGAKRCSSNQSASSVGAATPQGRSKTGTPNGDATTRESPSSRSNSLHSEIPTSSPSLPSKSSQYSPSSVLAMTDPSLKDLPLGTYKPTGSLPPSTSAAYLGYPPQLPIDVMASSLMSQHHTALKNGLGNPYLGYARMKTANGADTLVPVCRDPYCTGCQLNSQLLAGSNGSKISGSSPSGACPAGCAQCDHKPSSSSPYGPLGAHSPVAAAYAHAQLAALAAASQLPYICNWVAGDASSYCGKRFSTSEELLQHLRSHTNVSASDSAAAAAAAAAAALSLGLPPNHPLLSRSYPTPPLSPLATAARYHPYGKPSHLMPPSLSGLGLPMPPHPHHPSGLPPYFSPYSLYGGPRLGAASGMHP